MKKILMLTQTVFPPDIRLEREIKSLHEAGYIIHILCNQYEKGKGNNFPYCSITRIKAKYKNLKINKILNFPFFLNPRYLYFAFSDLMRFKPDVIHAHDLPMVPLALILKFFSRKTVLYDMHENYPEALLVFEKKGIINFIFKNYRLARILDKYCMKRVDRIIVVVKENKERLIKAGVNQKKIFIVSNTVDIDNFNGYITNDNLNEKYRNKKIIMYTGAVSNDRDLDTPIKAIKLLKCKVNNIKFLIVGDGPSLLSLKELAKKVDVETSVEFIPWPGSKRLPAYWNIADICTIPQPFNDCMNTTIPNKLFEYMFFKKPVLVSDAIPLKRIVEETNCGLVFKSHNVLDFADKAIELIQSNINFGKNGKNAVKQKYNWEIDAKILLNLYRQIG